MATARSLNLKIMARLGSYNNYLPRPIEKSHTYLMQKYLNLCIRHHITEQVKQYGTEGIDLYFLSKGTVSSLLLPRQASKGIQGFLVTCHFCQATT